MRDELQEYVDELRVTTAARERIESELRIAASIQMSLVPRTFPPFPQREDLELNALLEPAREVGGDFYDFFFLDDDHLCLAIADVSGKGVPAAICLPSPVPSSKIGACTGAGRPAHGKGSVWMCKS